MSRKTRRKRKLRHANLEETRYNGKMSYTLRDRIKMFYLNYPQLLMILIPTILILFFVDIPMSYKITIPILISLWFGWHVCKN